MLAVIGLAGLTFASEPTEKVFDNICLTGGGTATYAIIMAATGNISGRPPMLKGREKQLNYKIYLLHVDQWNEALGFPAQIDGSRSTVPVVSGEKWHYMAQSTTLKNLALTPKRVKLPVQ